MAWCLPGGEQCRGAAQASIRRRRSATSWPQVPTGTDGHCLAPLFQIPSKDDPKELPDPFNDLSVGGWEITDEPVGHLSMWAVSLQGKVRPVPRCAWIGGGRREAALPEVEGGGLLPRRLLLASCHRS